MAVLDDTAVRRGLGILAAAILLSQAAQAQATEPVVTAGSDVEQGLRVRQLTGAAPLIPWSIRAFSPRVLDTLVAGDSTAHHLAATLRPAGALQWGVRPARAGAIVNSTLPYGFNDGAIWAGRGLTVFAEGGILAQFGRVTASLAPVAFLAQNASFDLQHTNQSGRLMFADIRVPFVDRPQRYGDDPYGRIDPGESYLRIDWSKAAIGLSTATQFWGPAIDHPLILGNNAGGFPHAFVETPRPLGFKGVRISTRVIWGMLHSSEYTPSEENLRFTTAAVGTLGFSRLPGLELGAIRFYHIAWPRKGLLGAPYLKLFEAFLKESLVTADNPDPNRPNDNQLASVFARWVIPSSRIEVYAEYGREDHNWSLRDLYLQPDHSAAYLIGLQRAWTNDARTTVLRAEHFNSRISPLQVVSSQGSWYAHQFVLDGHTNRGQVLGSEGGLGGGATVIALERYAPRHRTVVRWDRLMRAENRGINGLPFPLNADVMHGLTLERSRLTGRGAVSASLAAVVNLNRDFETDLFNLNARMSWTIAPRPRHR